MGTRGSTRGTVLVVDDEPDIRYVIRIALEASGYAVTEAAHGQAALEQAGRSRPDLVVTDRMMPRMSGRELIERLRADESTKEIPILMISGTVGDPVGADALLGKPFDPAELVALADQLTRKER